MREHKGQIYSKAHGDARGAYKKSSGGSLALPGARLLAAAVCASLAFAVCSGHAEASPAILESASATVYASADEGSVPVGNLVQGNTFELAGSVAAEDGSAWYAVAMATGTQGYIKADAQVAGLDQADTGNTAAAGNAGTDGDSAAAGDTGADTDMGGGAAEDDGTGAPEDTGEAGAADGKAEAAAAEDTNTAGDDMDAGAAGQDGMADAEGEAEAVHIKANTQAKTYAVSAGADRVVGAGDAETEEDSGAEDSAGVDGGDSAAAGTGGISSMADRTLLLLICVAAGSIAAIRYCLRELEGMYGAPEEGTLERSGGPAGKDARAEKGSPAGEEAHAGRDRLGKGGMAGAGAPAPKETKGKRRWLPARFGKKRKKAKQVRKKQQAVKEEKNGRAADRKRK